MKQSKGRHSTPPGPATASPKARISTLSKRHYAKPMICRIQNTQTDRADKQQPSDTRVACCPYRWCRRIRNHVPDELQRAFVRITATTAWLSARTTDRCDSCNIGYPAGSATRSRQPCLLTARQHQNREARRCRKSGAACVNTHPLAPGCVGVRALPTAPAADTARMFATSQRLRPR